MADKKINPLDFISREKLKSIIDEDDPSKEKPNEVSPLPSLKGIDVKGIIDRVNQEESRLKLRAKEQPVPYDQYSEEKDARRLLRTGVQLSKETWKPIEDKPPSDDKDKRFSRLLLRDRRLREAVEDIQAERVLELEQKGKTQEEQQELTRLKDLLKKRKEQEKRRKEGRTDAETGKGFQLAEDIARATQKTITGEYLMEAAGLTPEAAKEYSREAGGNVGAMVGLAKGLNAAKNIPDARLKALAIGAYTAAGTIIGRAPSDPLRPTTAGEMGEAFIGGATAQTLLSAIPAKSMIPRMLIGGTEAVLGADTAMQVRSYLDKGEPIPYELKSTLQRLAFPAIFGTAVGGVTTPKKVKPSDIPDIADIAKARNNVIEVYKKRIAHHQSLQRARKGGEKKAQKEIIKTLKADLDAIYNNPTVIIDASNPELMMRTVTMLRQRESVLKLAKSEQAAAERMAFDDSMAYLNSLGKKGALDGIETLIKEHDPVPKVVTGDEAPFGLKQSDIKPKSVTDYLFKIDRGWKGKLSPDSRGGIHPLIPQSWLPTRAWAGAADVIEQAGRKDGSKLAIEAARRIRASKQNGDIYAGIATQKFLREARRLGFERIGKGKQSEKAHQEFEEYQRMLYRDSQLEGKADIPTRMEYVKGETVVDRVPSAPTFYETMSPMGKALVDGWHDASRLYAKEMKAIGVKVIDNNGNVREPNLPDNYWPIRLKAVYEEALRNPTSKTSVKAFDEMRRLLGVRTNDDVVKRLRDLVPEQATPVKSKDVDLTKSDIVLEDHLGGMFNHLEKGRRVSNVPEELLDFGVDLGNMYISNGGRRLAEIGNYGQGFKAGADGKAAPNPDYLWNVLKTATKNDPDTNSYISDLEKVLFSPRQGDLEWLNRATTGLMIANQKSAIKNLTGIAKPWLFTRTPQYSEGVVRGLASQLQDIGYDLRLFSSKSRIAELSEDIDAVSRDMVNRVQLIENKNLTDSMGRDASPSKARELWKKATGHRDITGGMLNISGFTPAENFTRKMTTAIADVNLKQIMRQIKEAPDAERIMKLRVLMEQRGGGAGLRMEIDRLVGANSANRRFDEAARFAAKNDIDLLKIRGEEIARRSREKAFKPEEHPETMKWYHAYGRESQGGYKADQLPMFMMSGELTKALLKFKNWSQQMQRGFDRYVVEEATQEGNYRPLFKWLATTQIAGEALNPAISAAFGRERSDAEWKEIAKAFEKDEGGKALRMLTIRAANNAMLSGMWDLWGGMIGDTAVRAYNVGKLDPVGTPAAAAEAQMLQEGIERWHDSGYDPKTAWQVVKGISLVNQTGNVVSVLTGDKKKRYLGKIRPRLKALEKEYFKEQGRDSKVYTGEIYFDEFTPMKEDLKKALYNGETEKASELFIDLVEKKMSEGDIRLAPSEEEKIIKGLQKTVRYHQPLKLGSSYSKEKTEDFVKWMEGTGWGGLEELKEMQDRYIKTAIDAGVIEPEPVETESQRDTRLAVQEGRRWNIVNDAKAKKFFDENKKLTPKDYLLKLYTRYGGTGFLADDTPEQMIERVGVNEPIVSRAKSLYLNKGKDSVPASVLLEPEYRRIPNEAVRADHMWEAWQRKGVSDKEVKDFMRTLEQWKMLSPKEGGIINKRILQKSGVPRR